MRRTSLARKSSYVFPCLPIITLTEPLDASEWLDVLLSFRGCVADDGFVVLGDGDLGVFDGDVIS